MAWYRAGGGGIPSSLKSDMNDVLNKKFGTSTTYPAEGWPDTVNLMGPLPEKTVSGEIVTFSDGADAVPLKKCEITLPASLDGYSQVNVKHAGKNLAGFDDGTYTAGGVTFTCNNQVVTASNTSTTTYPQAIIAQNLLFKKGTYTASITVENEPSGGSFYIILQKGGSNYVSTKNGSSTFTLTEDSQLNFLAVAEGNGITWNDATLKFQIEAGSTATTYEPYTAPTTHTANLGRTIYGGTADVVNGTAEPTNLLDVPAREEITRNGIVSSISADGTITASGQSTGNGDIIVTLGTSVNLIGGETYTFSIIGTDTRSGSVYVYFTGGSYISINNANHSGTYTPSADQTITGVTLRMFNTQTITLSAKIQLEKGSTSSDYSPYFEPFTFDPVPIDSKLGNNTLWSEQGDTEVTYRADINLALGGQ